MLIQSSVLTTRLILLSLAFGACLGMAALSAPPVPPTEGILQPKSKLRAETNLSPRHERYCCSESLFVAADLVVFTLTANTSIVTLNLSLMLNSVGFYQV